MPFYREREHGQSKHSHIISNIPEFNDALHAGLEHYDWCCVGERGKHRLRRRLLHGVITSHDTSYGQYAILEYWNVKGDRPEFMLCSYARSGGRSEAHRLCTAFQQKMIPIMKQNRILQKEEERTYRAQYCE